MPARVLVAMSGGVDSSTAAARLVEQGVDVVGVFMRNGVSGKSAGARSCCSLSDARDARAVADRLGVPFYAHDLARPFAALIDAFVADYRAGRTPNPCVVCNNDLKFGELLALADDLGCERVATGHYARVEDGLLRRGVDRAKDQSYLLHGLTREQLARAAFPIGHLTKEQVRAEATRLGLGVADKPDSADICFVPDGDYRRVLRAREGGLGTAGVVVDERGEELARHDGVGAFTVGQRRGLGVSRPAPSYVTAIDPAAGTVTVGELEDLACETARVRDVAWHERPAAGERVLVQLRHHHEPEPARLELAPEPEREPQVRGPAHDGAPAREQQARGPAHDGEPAREQVLVRFQRPSRACTPGQYAVFYRGDRVLGGGRLAAPVPADEPNVVRGDAP